MGKKKIVKENREDIIIYGWDFTLKRPKYYIVENGKLKSYLTKPIKVKIGNMTLYKEM